MKPYRARIGWLCIIGLLAVSPQRAETPVATRPPAAVDYEDVKRELLEIHELDQAGRVRAMALEKEKGRSDPEVRALWDQINQQDAENLERVRGIIDRYGWLSPDEVGQTASRALFLVIQHSNTKVREEFLPLMRAAANEGKLRPSQLAMLEDRVAIAQGRPQRYGSQLHGTPTGYRVSPVEDPVNLDQRRADVGLSPMSEYLKTWDLAWDPIAHAEETKLGIQLGELFGAHQAEFPRLREIEDRAGRDSPEHQAARTAMEARNTERLAQVLTLLEQHGWLGIKKAGPRGNGVVLLLFQSADLATKQRYLPMMREAVAAGDATAALVAVLEDQVALAVGQRQIYGTQLAQDPRTGTAYVAPLADAATVDVRRKAMQLPPMADFLARSGLTWDAEAYERDLPQIEARHQEQTAATSLQPVR